MHNPQISLKYAVRPYETLYRILIPDLQDGVSLKNTMKYIKTVQKPYWLLEKTIAGVLKTTIEAMLENTT